MTQPFHDTAALDKLRALAAEPEGETMQGGISFEPNGEVSPADIKALQNRVSKLEAAVRRLTRALGGAA